MRTKLVVVVVLTLVVAGQAKAQNNDRQVIEGVLRTFEAAFNSRDASTLAGLYADDAVLMPPGSPLMKGRAAIDAASKAIVARGGTLQFDPPVVEVEGARAIAAGTYTVTVSVPGAKAGAPGSTLVVHAKYLTAFKRLDKGWKIAYDMQNADAP